MANDISTLDVGSVHAKLALIAIAFPKAAARSLNEIAERTMTRSKGLTPVDTGRLKSTGRVKHARPSEGTAMEAELLYGTDYAIYVHEDPDAHHEEGQWKFLETAMDETFATFVAEFVAGVRFGQLI